MQNINANQLKLLLGVRIRQLRLQKELSLKDLGRKANLSVSYLSEVEKGKKYPKPEKLILLARALEISYEELVSVKFDHGLSPLQSILETPLLKEFPFQLFDIEPGEVLQLITAAPEKAGNFLGAFAEVTRSYDLGIEAFLFAALRAYQKMHGNYFEALETSARDFAKKFDLSAGPPLDPARLGEILTREYGFGLETQTPFAGAELQGFRSIWLDTVPATLMINPRLLPSQRAFMIGRELGYSFLKLSDRVKTSSWLKVESFNQILNNFKASYFAGALLLPQELLLQDLAAFFRKPAWEGEAFLAMMRRYEATPEIFLYRLSQLIPKHFGLNEIFYLRFNHKAGDDEYILTKELNMSHVSVPHGIGLHEHYCRRWLSIRLLQELARRQQRRQPTTTLIAAERSKFIESDAEIFTITLARPLALSEHTNSSMTIGFVMNAPFKRKVHFWRDPAIRDVEINQTCERCGLTAMQCQDRVAPPVIYEKTQQTLRREKALAALQTNRRQQSSGT